MSHKIRLMDSSKVVMRKNDLFKFNNEGKNYLMSKIKVSMDKDIPWVKALLLIK